MTHSFTGNLVSFGSLAHGRDYLIIYLLKGRMRVAPILYLLLHGFLFTCSTRILEHTSELKYCPNGVCKSTRMLLSSIFTSNKSP